MRRDLEKGTATVRTISRRVVKRPAARHEIKVRETFVRLPRKRGQARDEVA